MPTWRAARRRRISGGLQGRQRGRVRGQAQPGRIGPGLRNFTGRQRRRSGIWLAIDSAGDALVSGSTASTDFPVTADAEPKRFAGSPCLLTASIPFGNPRWSRCAAMRLPRAEFDRRRGVFNLLKRKRCGIGHGGGLRRGRLHVGGRLHPFQQLPTAGTPSRMRASGNVHGQHSPSSSQSFPCETASSPESTSREPPHHPRCEW